MPSSPPCRSCTARSSTSLTACPATFSTALIRTLHSATCPPAHAWRTVASCPAAAYIHIPRDAIGPSVLCMRNTSSSPATAPPAPLPPAAPQPTAHMRATFHDDEPTTPRAPDAPLTPARSQTPPAAPEGVSRSQGERISCPRPPPPSRVHVAKLRCARRVRPRFFRPRGSAIKSCRPEFHFSIGAQRSHMNRFANGTVALVRHSCSIRPSLAGVL